MATGFGSGGIPGGRRNNKRNRKPDGFYKNESDESDEYEEEEEDEDAEGEDEDAEGEDDTTSQPLPKRMRGTGGSTVPVGERIRKYDYVPRSFAGRDAWVAAQKALGAPRGCVDGKPEPYENYVKRRNKHMNWLRNILYVTNPAWKRAGNRRPAKPPVNPNRHEADGTDPRGWPKEPNSEAETAKQSKNRISRYLMWLHEPGNYKGDWPPGVHPCEDPNEPDPPTLPQRAQPKRPCTNCTEAVPKLRCSPWRGWTYDDDHGTVPVMDGRCEQCKLRNLPNCVAPDMMEFVDRKRKTKVPKATKPPPPRGYAHRYTDDRPGLIRRDERALEQMNESSAILDFSCLRCVSNNIQCDIMGPPRLTEGSFGEPIIPKVPTCRQCQQLGLECETSEAWNSAMAACIRRAVEQNQILDDSGRFRDHAPNAGFDYGVIGGGQQQQQQGFGQPVLQPQAPYMEPGIAAYAGPAIFVLPEGMQCMHCRSTGQGDFCDFSTPCAPCILSGFTDHQCRPINQNWGLPLTMDASAEMDFGMAIDPNLSQPYFPYQNPQNQPNPPRNYASAADFNLHPRFENPEFLTEMRRPIPRPGENPAADADLELALAWNSVAKVALARGIAINESAILNPSRADDDLDTDMGDL